MYRIVYRSITNCYRVFSYGSGTLTKVFVDRVFQECLTYDGEMVSIYLLYQACKIVFLDIAAWQCDSQFPF